MTISEELCEHVVRTRYQDLPQEAIERAKVRLLDSFGNIVACRNGAGNDMMFDLLSGMGGAEEASVFGYGRSLPAMNAAMMNSLILRSFDFEAVEGEGKDNKRFPAHITSVTVPVVLAMSQKVRCSGQDLLLALVLGDDFVCRVGGAGESNPFNSFWDNTGTFNVFGATVVAGKLLGLDAFQLKNALGLAVNMMSGSNGCLFDHVMAFKLPGAMAARNGIMAAELAKRGFTGLKDPLQGHGGYYDIYCPEYDPGSITEGLGEVYYADVTIKAYSACRSTHAAIETAALIKERYAIEPEKISKVVLHVSERVSRSFIAGPFVLTDVPQIDGTFSLQFTVANGLMEGYVRPEHYTVEHMSDSRMVHLYECFELVGDLDVGIYGQDGALLEVHEVDGSVHSEAIRAASGDIYLNPFSEDVLIGKYYKNIAFSGGITKEQGSRARDIVEGLEGVEDLGELFAIFS